MDLTCTKDGTSEDHAQIDLTYSPEKQPVSSSANSTQHPQDDCSQASQGDCMHATKMMVLNLHKVVKHIMTK